MKVTKIILLFIMGLIILIPFIEITTPKVTSDIEVERKGITTDSNSLDIKSSQTNLDIIDSVLDEKIAEYTNKEYYHQIFRPSLGGTYYTLYILNIVGKLYKINQSETLNFIISHYNTNNNTFSDFTANRYLDSYTGSIIPAYESLLISNCHAVLALNILGNLSLINNADMINFIWSCYNPIDGGFIGRPYQSSLPTYFQASTLENTYWAILTLDLLMVNWMGYTTERANLIQWINDLQNIGDPNPWNNGGFQEDFSSEIKPCMYYSVNMRNNYLATSALDVFGMVDSIDLNALRTHASELYDSINYKFHHNAMTKEYTINDLDIPCSAMGVRVADLCGLSYNRANVLNFVMNGRNSRGYWYRSDSMRTFHEIINSFEVIHALNYAGELTLISSVDRELLANSIISDFYAYNGGFSYVSDFHMSTDLLYTIVESFNYYDRLAELDFNMIYDRTEKLYFNGRFSTLTGIFSETGIGTCNIFRNAPIESRTNIPKIYQFEYEIGTDQENAFYILTYLDSIFKLDDFDSTYNIDNVKDEIVNTQFLDPAYPNHFGGFLPTSSMTSAHLDYMFLENAYYAIRALEKYIEYKGSGDLESLGIDTSALETYLFRKIVETSTEIYVLSEYGNTVEDNLESTFQMMYLLNALGINTLDTQKIENFVDNSIDYTNIENVYYCYEILNLINVSYSYNLTLTHNLLRAIYINSYNEFSKIPGQTRITQEILFQVSKMSVEDEYRAETSNPSLVMLGKNLEIEAFICNIMLEEVGPYASIVFESTQLGTHNFINNGNSYNVSVYVPTDSANYPMVSGKVCIYEGITKISEKLVTTNTFYDLYVISSITESFGRISINGNISLVSGSGVQALFNTQFYAEISKDGKFLESTSLTVQNGMELSEVSLTYTPSEEGLYFISVYLINDYEPVGRDVFSGQVMVTVLVEGNGNDINTGIGFEILPFTITMISLLGATIGISSTVLKKSMRNLNST